MTHPSSLLPWRKRRPTLFKWTVALGALLVMGGVIALVFGIVLGHITSSDVYLGAVARAKTSPVVIAALGAPLHEGWLVSGNIHVSNATGLAELAIPLSGAKAKGTLYVEATKHEGDWQFDHLVLQLDSTGERLDLAPAPSGPPTR